MRAPDVSLELLVEALARGHPQRMRALGTSMWPTIPGGSLLELSPADPAHPPNPGDVVAVRSRDGRFLVHRVCGVRGDGARLLMGDHCLKPDGWFSLDEVVALVTRMDDGAGWRAVPRQKTPMPPLLHRARRRLARFFTELSRCSRPDPAAD